MWWYSKIAAQEVLKGHRKDVVEVSHDINMTLGWSTPGWNIIVCILCSSMILLVLRKRILTYWEALRLQGFPVAILAISDPTQHKGMELAGNAFCAFVIQPLVTASIMYDPEFTTARFPAEQESNDGMGSSDPAVEVSSDADAAFDAEDSDSSSTSSILCDIED